MATSSLMCWIFNICITDKISTLVLSDYEIAVRAGEGQCSERDSGMTGAASATTTRDPVKIVANIFISFIGAGVLGLPYAFKRVSLGDNLLPEV